MFARSGSAYACLLPAPQLAIIAPFEPFSLIFL